MLLAVEDGLDQWEVIVHIAITRLLDQLERLSSTCSKVIEWGSPVPAFGNPSTSILATVGLNPSNKEFVDDFGCELSDSKRRFHTLRSLGLKSWLEVDASHIQLMVDSCCGYFDNNPYDRWFKRMDRIISGTATSLYSKLYPACHLDIIPYATAVKWGELGRSDRALLLAGTRDALGYLLRDSPIRVLVLNGQSVVQLFQNILGAELEIRPMAGWSLSRDSGRGIPGLAYIGAVDSLAGINLNRELLILGYNHNIQSSFGITSGAVSAIGNWIAQESKQVLR
jgi:hypothetical protein